MAQRKTRCLVGTDAGSYTFSAVAKTVTFSAGLVASIEDVLLITNVVDNIVIYQFNVVGKGGTLAGDVLTLTYNTTVMSNTDELQIWVIADPTLPLKVTFDGTAQPVSVSGTVAVTGALTNAELRATPVPVSATNLDIRDLVFATDKVDVSGSTIAVTGAGDATAANQVLQLAQEAAAAASLASIDAGVPASLGQQVMAASMPVVIASDQSEIPVTSTEIIEHLDSLIIAIRKATQTIYKPPYANEIGMVKVIPGAATGTLPVSGSVAITTMGGGLIDQTFMQYFQNKIMINTWHSQLITR